MKPLLTTGLRGRFLVAAAAMLLGTATAAGPAAAADPDRVAYYPSGFTADSTGGWVPRPLSIVDGAIQKFDAQSLEILAAGAAEPQVVATKQIVWIRAGWDDASASAGNEAFQQGRYDEAIAPLLEAVQRGPAAWRQQWLLALLSSAAFESGRYAAAFELVGQLDRSDLPAPLLDLLPIAYTPGGTPRAADAARPMLARAEPLVRLLAASVLLTGADAAAAERVLQQLAVQTERPLVARLAEAVLWRRTPPPQVSAAAAAWWDKIDRLPPSIAGGPMVVVADRLQAAGLNDQALEAWLTVQLLASGDGPRSDIASQRVGELRSSDADP